MTNRLRRRQGAAALLALGAAILGVVTGCMWLGGPEAVISASTTAGVVSLTVAFDGAGSTAPAEISRFVWDPGDGSAPLTGAAVEHTYHHAGSFEATLTVVTVAGRSDTATIAIEVGPAVWTADRNLDRLYKLGLDGTEIARFDLPVSDPAGVAIGETAGRLWVYVACYGGGNQRVLRVDPTTGAVDSEFSAPGGDPQAITYADDEPKRLWHVDSLARSIYGLDRSSLQILDRFGCSYFGASEPFLRRPQGLAWTPAANASGHLWYLEGETRRLHALRIVPAYDIMSNTQLELLANPVELSQELFPVSGMDWYSGRLWVVSADEHRIVEVDPATGAPTGRAISGWQGANASGLAIQQ